MPWINKLNLGLAEVGSTVLVRCAGVLLRILVEGLGFRVVDKTEQLERRLCLPLRTLSLRFEAVLAPPALL